ncbi:MAG: lipoyl protein ligase domain-containing protein, partial [Chloroflexota bacterium]
PGRPGVWVEDEKLAAIGIKVARGWVSYHGCALNVDPDLRWFEHIVPCGLHGLGVTSLSRLLGRPVAVDDVAERLAACFERRFAVTLSAPHAITMAGVSPSLAGRRARGLGPSS